MRPIMSCLLGGFLLLPTACGGGDGSAPVPATAAGPAATVAVPPEVVDIASIAQFDAEVAKARPGAVVVADFHAEWCGPCKKLGPELVALAAAHPGKLIVLRIDIDQQPDLAGRFQVESIPLLVKFAGGVAGERKLGYLDQARLAQWLAIP